MPLSSEQVAQFWDSFRTFRDLALVGLMLLDGLRSCEVLAVELESLQLAERHIHILGVNAAPSPEIYRLTLTCCACTRAFCVKLT